MASIVSVDLLAFTDPRFDIAAKSLGVSKFDVLGRMLMVWKECTIHSTYYLSDQIIDALVQLSGFGDALVTAELAERMPKRAGFIRVKGTRERIEWYKKVKAGAKRGGMAVSKKLQRNPNGTYQPFVQPLSSPGGPAEASSTTTTTSTTTSTSSKTKKEKENRTKEKVSAEENREPKITGAMLIDGCTEWSLVLKKYGMDRLLTPRERTQVGEAIVRHGFELVVQAMRGFAARDWGKNLDPGKFVSLDRLFKHDRFLEYVNLGQKIANDSQAKPENNEEMKKLMLAAGYRIEE